MHVYRCFIKYMLSCFFFFSLGRLLELPVWHISNFRPTNSASSRENLRNRVFYLCRQLWIFETIFSLFLVPISSISEKKSFDSRNISASLCSAQKLIKYSKPNAVQSHWNAFMRDFPDFVEIYPYASFQLSQHFIYFNISDHIWS